MTCQLQGCHKTEEFQAAPVDGMCLRHKSDPNSLTRDSVAHGARACIDRLPSLFLDVLQWIEAPQERPRLLMEKEFLGRMER